MLVSKLSPLSLVLAWDRVANCTRLVPAVETELLDAYGSRVTDYEEVDTEKGLLWRVDANGKRVKERGMFYVTVKDERARARLREGR